MQIVSLRDTLHDISKPVFSLADTLHEISMPIFSFGDICMKSQIFSNYNLLEISF